MEQFKHTKFWLEVLKGRSRSRWEDGIQIGSNGKWMWTWAL